MSTITARKLKRYDWTQGPRKLGPADGKLVQLLTIGVRFMAWGDETGGGFSLVEHPMPPKTLAAPVHIHEREDEYSFVLEGRILPPAESTVGEMASFESVLAGAHTSRAGFTTAAAIGKRRTK